MNTEIGRVFDSVGPQDKAPADVWLLTALRNRLVNWKPLEEGAEFLHLSCIPTVTLTLALSYFYNRYIAVFLVELIESCNIIIIAC